jgi:hypothetical protein
MSFFLNDNFKGWGRGGDPFPTGGGYGWQLQWPIKFGGGGGFGTRGWGGKTRPRLAPLPCVNTLLLFYFLGTQEYFTSIIGRYTYLYSALKIC